MGQVVDNSLLAALGPADLNRLRSRLERVPLPKGKVLFQPGDAIRYVHFPSAGIVSLIALSDQGDSLEVASVGPEGVIGLPSVLSDAPSPHEAVVQIAGEAFRYPLILLTSEFKRSPVIQRVLLAYTSIFLTQLCAGALCYRYHTVEQRVAGTLLRARQSVQSDCIELTQETLARILSVQRTAVSSAATGLQDKNLIRFRHGRIRVADPAGLEARACECYRLCVRGSITGASCLLGSIDQTPRNSSFST